MGGFNIVGKGMRTSPDHFRTTLKCTAKWLERGPSGVVRSDRTDHRRTTSGPADRTTNSGPLWADHLADHLGSFQ